MAACASITLTAATCSPPTIALHSYLPPPDRAEDVRVAFERGWVQGIGHPPFVRHLWRTFVVNPAREPRDFQIYFYVLFSGQGASTERLRRAVSEQVLRLFQDVSAGLGSGPRPPKTALLVYPLQSETSVEALRTPQTFDATAGALVRAYDYPRAQAVWDDLNRQIPELCHRPLASVTLVASDRPLLDGGRPSGMFFRRDFSLAEYARMEVLFDDLKRQMHRPPQPQSLMNIIGGVADAIGGGILNLVSGGCAPS